MNCSQYNYFIPTKREDTYILYNTFSGAIFFVDKELKNAIQHNPSNIPEDLLEDFKKEWVILDDDIDEIQAISVMRDERRYNSPWLQFMIMTTYDCNLACPYCYEKKDPVTSMDNAAGKRIRMFITKLIEKYRPTHLEFLMYGGEPLLNVGPMYILLDYFKEYTRNHSLQFQVNITTNGTLVTPEIITALEKYPVGVVQVTLDGPKNLHNKTRIYKNGNGSYEDIVKGLHLLQKSDFTPKIRINVDANNKERIPELLDDLKERGLNTIPIYFGIIRPMSSVCESYTPSCMQTSEIKSTIPDLWKIALEKGFDIPLKPFTNLVGCGMQSNSSYTIDPEGHVYKCVTGVGYPDKRIGTIDETGTIPAWNSVYYEWMARNPLQFPGCRVCTFFPLCGGGCPMIAYARHGTYETGGCFETKHVLKDQLKLYLKQKYPEKIL